MGTKNVYLMNALITGGVRRLGRYISYYLADRGYNLAIIYNSSSQNELKTTAGFLESKNIEYNFYKCDVSNLGSLKLTIEKINSDFKCIDLLINNAGIIKKIDFEKISEKIYDDILNTNLKAQLFTVQYSLKMLRKSSDASIINIASLGGLKNWVDFFPYCISKAGVIKLTYLLAKKLAPDIRVNAIAPGTIIIKNEESDFIDHVKMESLPLKKYGEPADITLAVGYLIESKYVTGQLLTVDGGRMVVT